VEESALRTDRLAETASTEPEAEPVAEEEEEEEEERSRCLHVHRVALSQPHVGGGAGVVECVTRGAEDIACLPLLPFAAASLTTSTSRMSRQLAWELREFLRFILLRRQGLLLSGLWLCLLHT